MAATLVSGPNVLVPMDLGLCSDCGSPQFNFWVGAYGTTPKVGDTYSFQVTYSDGTSESKTAAVSAVLSAFASQLSPTGTGASLKMCIRDSYTTNGTTPTTSSTKYTTAISVSATETIEAIAVAAGYTNSAVASAKYTIQSSGLTFTTPSNLPSATVGVSYAGAINVSGGGPNYSWTVNGAAVPTTGVAVSIADGLTASNTAGYTLTLGGTPTSATTVTFNVSAANVTGDASPTASVGPVNFSIVVNQAGNTVSGNISLTNNCASGVSSVSYTHLHHVAMFQRGNELRTFPWIVPQPVQ